MDPFTENEAVVGSGALKPYSEARGRATVVYFHIVEPSWSQVKAGSRKVIVRCFEVHSKLIDPYLTILAGAQQPVWIPCMAK